MVTDSMTLSSGEIDVSLSGLPASHLPNKRLKLPGRLSNEEYVCAPANSYRRARRLRPPALAPQLKRDPLGGGSRHIAHAVHVVSIPTQFILSKWQKPTGLRSIIRCGIRPDWQSTAGSRTE